VQQIVKVLVRSSIQATYDWRALTLEMALVVWKLRLASGPFLRIACVSKAEWTTNFKWMSTFHGVVGPIFSSSKRPIKWAVQISKFEVDLNHYMGDNMTNLPLKSDWIINAQGCCSGPACLATFYSRMYRIRPKYNRLGEMSRKRTSIVWSYESQLLFLAVVLSHRLFIAGRYLREGYSQNLPFTPRIRHVCNCGPFSVWIHALPTSGKFQCMDTIFKDFWIQGGVAWAVAECQGYCFLCCRQP
jgi:hypothetical protein